MTEQQPAPLGPRMAPEYEAFLRQYVREPDPREAEIPGVQGRATLAALLTEIDRLRAALAEAEAKRQEARGQLRYFAGLADICWPLAVDGADLARHCEEAKAFLKDSA